MLVSISKLEFVAAFYYNPFLFITGPLIVAYLAFAEIKYVSCGSRRMGKFEIFLWAELLLLIVYGILRNILGI